METTRLGRTGLTVTRSAFGALPVQRLTLEEGAALLRRGFEMGINFFDTARGYSNSEEKMGMGLSDVRDRIVIATKTPSTAAEGFWRDLEASLSMLKTDYIDIYQFHNPSKVPAAGSEAYACMVEAKKQGKIRHIGITCHLLSNAYEALESGLYDTIQYPLSALSSDEEVEWAKKCGERDVGVIAMKALCGGLLTSAAPSMAFLRPMAHVVPIWGFQRDGELNEVIELEKNPPALDEAMRERIERDRAELGGDFCRGCGYCMPCTVGIRINMVARMPQLIRRSPPAPFFSDDWNEAFAVAETCTDCGLCMSRCPYGLEIPRLIRVAIEDRKAYAAENGYKV